MKTTEKEPRLEVSDLEFVPTRTYVARHGCGEAVFGRGTDIRQRMDAHTESCAASKQ
jgi:hypothetical protein